MSLVISEYEFGAVVVSENWVIRGLAGKPGQSERRESESESERERRVGPAQV